MMRHLVEPSADALSDCSVSNRAERAGDCRGQAALPRRRASAEEQTGAAALFLSSIPGVGSARLMALELRTHLRAVGPSTCIRLRGVGWRRTRRAWRASATRSRRAARPAPRS